MTKTARFSPKEWSPFLAMVEQTFRAVPVSAEEWEVRPRTGLRLIVPSTMSRAACTHGFACLLPICPTHCTERTVPWELPAPACLTLPKARSRKSGRLAPECRSRSNCPPLSFGSESVMRYWTAPARIEIFKCWVPDTSFVRFHSSRTCKGWIHNQGGRTDHGVPWKRGCEPPPGHVPKLIRELRITISDFCQDGCSKQLQGASRNVVVQCAAHPIGIVRGHSKMTNDGIKKHGFTARNRIP